MKAKYEIFIGKDGQYYFRLRATGNHEIILSSTEGYTTKASCRNGIDAVRVNSPVDSKYTRLPASNGQYHFVLKAANYEPIGKSETYHTEAGREVGITAVKRDGPTAEVEDTTTVGAF